MPIRLLVLSDPHTEVVPLVAGFDPALVASLP
jgi:hypothetical protein